MRRRAGDRQTHDRVVDRGGELFLDGAADPHRDARAIGLERALRGVGRDEACGQHRERREAAARQHPVVDLEHVERAGEEQQVRGGRDREDRAEGRRASPIASASGGGVGRGWVIAVSSTVVGSATPSRVSYSRDPE